MELEVGSILTGKVISITKFGAFVSVAPNKSGLVHISEIANTYVNDVSDYLTVGQEVKVKLINIDQSGRINLSIKQAVETPRPAPQVRRPFPPQQQRPFNQQRPGGGPPRPDRRPGQYASNQAAPASGDASFEDKLKRFMQDSESKMSSSKQYSEKKTARRRGSWSGGEDD